jgi:hypothetical protein
MHLPLLQPLLSRHLLHDQLFADYFLHFCLFGLHQLH